MLVKIIKTSSTLSDEAKKRNKGDSYYSLTSLYVKLFVKVDLSVDLTVCSVDVKFEENTVGVDIIEFLETTDFCRILSLVIKLLVVAITKL